MTDIRKPTDYDPTRDGESLFCFADGTRFPCHPLGTYWNGFDNVRVSREVRDVIVAAWREEAERFGWSNPAGEEDSTVADLLAIEPDEDGLVDLSNGWASELCEEVDQ